MKKKLIFVLRIITEQINRRRARVSIHFYKKCFLIEDLRSSDGEVPISGPVWTLSSLSTSLEVGGERPSSVGTAFKTGDSSNSSLP